MDIDRLKARAILIGTQFKPKEKDIETPQLLLDAGIPADSLRLIGLPAKKAIELRSTAKGDEALSSALLVCACLRWRDPSTNPPYAPILNMADAPALCEQDVDLLNVLGPIVADFIGLNRQKEVDDAKNDSEATQKNSGGSESPVTLDTTPQELAREPSNTAILSIG